MSSDLTHYTLTNTKLALAIVAFVISCGIGFLVLFYLRKFWILRQHPFISKRYPLLVATYAAAILIFILVERAFSSVIHCGIYSSIWFQWMRWICFVFMLHASCFLLILRVYLVFFNVKWTKLNDANKWKNYIDTTYSDQNNNAFFIKYKASFGSIHYIYKYFILAWFVSSALPVCLLPVGFFYASLCDAVILLPLVFILFFLWLKTPLFHDEFLIHQEIRNMLITFALLMIHYMIFIVSGLIFGETFVQWYITHIFTIFFVAAMALFATMYPMYEYEKMRQQQKAQYGDEISIGSGSAGSNRSPRTPPQHRHSGLMMHSIKLDITDVIKAQIGFDAFMIHLSKEWSMENLLAVVEMTQYKLRILQITTIQEGKDEKEPDKLRDSVKFSPTTSKSCDSDGNDHESHYEDVLRVASLSSLDSFRLKDIDKYQQSKQTIIELPKTLPLSTIVYGDYQDEEIDKMDKINECKRIIKELFEKYILIGAEMEVNLSYKKRQYVMNKYQQINDMNQEQLFCIFDKCIRSLLQLMQDSYLRFKATTQFIHYEKNIKKRMSSTDLTDNSP